MKHLGLLAAVLFASTSSLVASCQSKPLALGAAGVYSLLAVGADTSNGNTALPGTLHTSAAVSGPVAAADAAPVVALHNTLVSTGEQPTLSARDFRSLRASAEAESASLARLSPNGAVRGTHQPGMDPSFFVLKGSSHLLNVFNLTAEDLADADGHMDIEVPTGSTILLNIAGDSAALSGTLLLRGTPLSAQSEAGEKLLLNFPDATHVTLHGSCDASLIAPWAVLDGDARMRGTFIAAQIASTGPVQHADFTGVLPPGTRGVQGFRSVQAPEPASMTLLGTGLLGLAGILRRRTRKANAA